LRFVLLLLVSTFCLRAEPSPELSRLGSRYLETAASSDREALSRYAQSARGEEAALAHFALGMGDHQADRFAAAAEEFSLAESLSELRDYVLYYHGRSLAQEEDFPAAAALLGNFSDQFPKSRLGARAERIRVESLIRAERLDEARPLLAKGVLKRLPESSRHFLLGRVDDLSGSVNEAIKSYRRAYYFYPLSDDADAAETRLNELRRALGKAYPDAPAKWRLARGDALFAAGRWEKAAHEFQYARPGLSGVELDRARVRYGAASYRRLRTTNAQQWLQGVQTNDPELAAERLYYLAECSRRKGKTKQFIALTERLGREHPESSWYEEALFSLGNHFLLKNDEKQSRYWYERSARAFPKGKRSTLAHWKVCWRAYREDDPRTRSLFEEHLSLYPQSPQSSAVLYWLGRIYEREGDEVSASALYDVARLRFPNHYYAGLARGRLDAIGEPKQIPIRLGTLTQALPKPRVVSFEASEANGLLLERGRLLFGLGLSEISERELASGSYRSADAPALGLELARQTAERGLYYRALRYMKRYGFGYLRMEIDSKPREFWERLFPLPWRNELERRARPHDLDPYLVAGLIRQESEFNARAVSRAGALGLMQIMPSTGRGLARRLGINGFRTTHLHRPDTSLRLGTFHLKQVLKKYPDDIEVSLAAYNAGETRANAWITWGDFREPAEFVETIPFTETRGYVQAVLRNRDVYRRLYGEKPPPTAGE